MLSGAIHPNKRPRSYSQLSIRESRGFPLRTSSRPREVWITHDLLERNATAGDLCSHDTALVRRRLLMSAALSVQMLVHPLCSNVSSPARAGTHAITHTSGHGESSRAHAGNGDDPCW
jgi:hypothetical protein